MGEIVPESLRQDGNAAADPPGPTALRSPLRSPLSDGVEFLVGQASDWDPVQNVRVRETFDREAIGFLDTLSRRLMSDPAARQFPDVVAFAFWCRGSALRVLRSVFEDGRVSLGRGLGFHVAPANVPIMAAYNLAIGLLAGNSTIVRLPSRGIPQTEYLCRQIVTLLDCDAHAALRCSMACIKYDRERTDVTRYLSARCDARVIWGGDATVNEIRRTPLQPHASELTFPDRFSIAVIDSEAWLRAGDKDRLVHGFYNDTYLNDQASCSAPRLVLWLGSRMADARADFWGRVEALVADRHRPVPAQTLRKLEFAYCLLARDRGCRLDSRYPHVMRVWSETLRPDLLDLHPDGGVFVECQGQGIDVLRPILARRCQTVSYLGVPADDIVTLIRNAGTQGGDRVVPMGQTLDFSLTWDGHDILRALSRTLSVVAIPSNRGNA